MMHKHEVANAGREFVEQCSCGALRIVGDEKWKEERRVLKFRLPEGYLDEEPEEC